MELEGYDWAGMYDRWKQCENTIGVEDGWSYLRREETMKEAEKRDSKWLLTGEKPQYITLEGAKPSDDEKRTANRLSEFGFLSEFRATRDGKRTSDAFLVTKNGLEEWEYKHPTGNGRWTVYHQFEDAAGQSKRLVIDISELEKPDTGTRWNRQLIEAEAIEQLSRPFRVPKGKDKGQTWLFDEVVLVSDDGKYCRRFTNS